MSVFAFSDLHAQYDLWQQIKEYIKPNDVIYCLGDILDRGTCGLEILNEIMKIPNIILLKGNHEDLLFHIGSKILKSKKENTPYYLNPNICRLMSLWQKNGAKNTIHDFLNLSIEEKQQLIENVQKLSTYKKYINKQGNIIHLCHAGMQPNTTEIPDMKMGNIPMNNYIWDRFHLLDLYWHGKDYEYCVHGHTPVEYLRYYINSMYGFPKSSFEIYKYCEGHKIDIDLGSFRTHTACLLNLDTFEPIYFKDRTLSEDSWEKIKESVKIL